MKVAVIGAGMAGLTAAAYMAQRGHQVTVYEQFPTIGGVTATLHCEGFGWDLGPLMLEGFGPGEPAAQVLAELGVAGQVPSVRADRGISLPDFTLFPPAVYAGPFWRRERLKELFPAERDGLDRYYALYDRIMDLMALSRRAEAAAGPAALLLKARMWLAFQVVRPMANWDAGTLMDQLFHGPELKALFTGILADFVVRPSQFPGLGIPTVNLETAFDKRIPAQVSPAGPRPTFRYILGGCGTLVDAVAGAVRAASGDIRTSTSVRRIVVEPGADGQPGVTGLALDSGFEPADLVLASGGARETFLGLVGREHLPPDLAARVDDVPLMESVLMVHLGIDFDPAPYQPSALCYYYCTYDVEGAVGRCQSGDYHEGRDGFLIYIPSKHSAGLAPPGCHALTVYTIAPDRLASGSWAERRAELADKLVSEAERVIPGLREHALAQVVLTPDDFRQRTHLEHHSFGGAAPLMGREGAPHHTGIGGLWFIGAQSESRGGVAGVMAGARRTVRMIEGSA